MPNPLEHDYRTYRAPTDFRTIDPETGMRVLHVHAYFVQCLAVHDVYREDWLAPGVYQVLVPANLSDELAAMCAFMTFHWVIPIKRLCDFDINVREPNGREVFPDFNIEDPESLVDISGPVTKLLPAKHLAARPGWQSSMK